MGKRQVRFIQFYYWEVICNLMRFGRVILPGPFWFFDIIPITLEGRRSHLHLSCPVFSLAGGKAVVLPLGIGMCDCVW